MTLSKTLNDSNGLPYAAGAVLYGVAANGTAVTLLVTSSGDLSFAALAGERGASPNDYLRTRSVETLSVISKTTAVSIGGGVANDTNLSGITVVAALTGTCVITGFADSDGAAQSITLPAATAAGFKDFRGALNAAGALTITCSNAADDNLVLVHWSPST